MKPNILLIGCGSFGKNHLRVLKNLEDEGRIKLEGVVTASEESSKKVSEEYGVKSFNELTESLLESVDAVDITTPASAHYGIIKKAVGKAHVLSEKPLALSVNEMKDIKKLAEESGKIVMVGHIFRFNRAVDKLKELVAENIDSLEKIEGKFLGKAAPQKDCGAIATIMHLFDVLEYILGRSPVSVKCTAEYPLKREFEDYAASEMDYGKFKAFLEIGWVGEKKERSITFKFKEMEVYCNMLNQAIKIKGNKERNLELGGSEPLREEIECFISLVEGKKMGYPGVDTAIKIQKVVDACYKSDKAKSAAEVEP